MKSAEFHEGNLMKLCSEVPELHFTNVVKS
jgi:hypothetical protein